MEGYTKSLPPLDLKFKSETGIEKLRDEFLSECADFISRGISFSEDASANPVTPEFDHNTLIVKDPKILGIKAPLRIALARGGSLGLPADNLKTFEQFVGAIEQYTGIAVRNCGQVFLYSGDLSNLNVLFISSYREFGVSDQEAANVARFLRTGGFVVIDYITGGRDAGRTVTAFARAISNYPEGGARVAPVSYDHPLWQAFFHFPKTGIPDAKRENTRPNPLYGVWFEGRLAIVCFCGMQSSFHPSAPYREQNLQIAVNALTFALTRSPDISGSTGIR
jgi:hypothetical protein